ncbi:site-specific DNA-methyltransferase [Phosphitispora fastidiosa]|uniref:site-specific DNA-methyltransferase n=1 Tax=Phosphitispora fastidiosa TaxID=2837202 RepID=UPI001E47EC4C|nr:site-specific DNA-methyltransferase [Phosphitispora fastidiosa]MBU7008721.1 DNA modification methylase [Phosphitispora fastidiosa]
MLLDMEISPKLNNDNPVYPQNSWYFYYAGYADGFIKHAIEKYGNTFKSPVIVDPWNGSGTTTLVASMMHLTCYGFDINPAMILIAKAKLYNAKMLDIEEMKIQLSLIIPTQLSNEEYSEDPLNNWFTLESLSIIRNIEEVIQNITGFKQNDRKLIRIKGLCNIETLSYEMSFYYLALFTTIKQFTKVFVGSNPTWIKSKNIEKLNIDSSELVKLYLSNIESMKTDCSEGVDLQKIYLSIGDSKSIPLKNETADMVITSPPYCTRIDYAVYTKIELSLLGYNSSDIQNLRREMIGTPTIRKGIDYSKPPQHIQFLEVSNSCLNTMEQILTHQSKAAKSYYYKTFIQYFIGMYESVKEIYRILNKNGIAIIVVQDSWFKDVYVDVPGIVIEFAQSCGFSIIEKNDYEVRNNMNYINTKSRGYKKSKRSVESVITFRKG